MGSRIKESPERIFEGYFEVLRPTDSDKESELKRQFPDLFDDQDSVTTLTKFCFPFDVKRWKNSSVQHFSFTLTDLQGYQRFGFCRLSVEAKSCTCILSCLPWFELFYKLLNHIAEHLVKDQINEVTHILQTLYDHPVPEVNKTLDLEMFSYFVAPDPAKLPSIPENRNLTEFLVAVQVDTMLQLYSSLLCERRILITSSKLSTLTACVHASAALLYPMYWQHIYIPTLPPHLLDYCGAPMPYLIGVHSSLMEQVNVGVLEDVVIFNMDTNYLETPFQDLESLPPHVVSLLKLQLTKHSAFMGDGVSRAFLRAQALLFGSYREALNYNLGEPITFCQETFLDHKSSSMRSFLQNAVHLQLFSQFIDTRLEKLNYGDEFTDLFEQEVTKCGLSGASRSYQLWLENLKKGGGTLINNMKNRTHPTVRNMLRYAKGQAKTGLQGMKRRIKHKDQRQIQHMGSFKADGTPTQNHDRLQHRLPITQHFGQSRPRRPGKKYSECDSWEGQRFGEDGTSEEGDSGLAEANDFPLLDDGMDLLNEIFETLNTRAPGRERALYGAHSLDCFSLDDSQYFGQISEEDLRLSLSHPRHSDLWYLPEVDEGTADSLESVEDSSFTLDNISNSSDHASPILDVAAFDTVSNNPDTTSVTEEDILSSAFDTVSNIPDTTSVTEEDISSSAFNIISNIPGTTSVTEEDIPSSAFNIISNIPGTTSVTEEDISSSEFAEVTYQKPDSSLSISETTISSSEVVSAVPQVISQTSPVTSEVKIIPPCPEPEICPTPKEGIKQEAVLPLLPQKDTTMRKAFSETPRMVAGTCVRSAVSRFQTGTLDPRMVWTGTKKDTELAEKVIPNLRSFNTPRPLSQQYSSPKPNSPLYRFGPVFLRSQSTPKLEIPKSPISDTPIPLARAHDGLMPVSPNSSVDDVKHDMACSQLSSELKPSHLPKVSELKKRFEADSLQ
ncbi:PREDICTED: DENN domain-containing protein 1B-like [Nanorana parkeri]|uniref:DENN domain-containing protein 1B-like n=1 Tax=Nanorana parkeri TaxID=125878 RepID=UPI000854B42E|nr:PREDICTED: DENN domain-containing protein 1B-like [Nanorana parkeri]